MDAVERNGRGTGWVLVQIPLLTAVIAVPVAQALLGRFTPWPSMLLWPARGMGACGLLISLVLYLTARRVLGPNLVPHPRPPDAAVLRDDGIYGFVRHPVYLGILIGAASWALLWSSTVGLILAAICVPFFLLKISHEERFLVARFPRYVEYRERVPSMFPRCRIPRTRLP